MLTLCVGLMGCQIGGLDVSLPTGGSSGAASAEARQSGPDLAGLREPGCYTVDLFSDQPIQRPGPEVPPEFAQFIGSWEGGSWNGEWCHDLLIYQVDADGTAHLLDMHAPNDEFGLAPTVFRRKGTIREDGALYFAYGIETRRYELRRGVLFARRDGGYGTMEAALVNANLVPVPLPRPVRAARGT